MDHLEKTPGFTLQHVRFLVMDEADRLLNQSYQNWLGRVLQATVSHNSSLHLNKSLQQQQQQQHFNDLVIDPLSWRHDTMAEYKGQGSTVLSTLASICHPIQLRKLLFSATMTTDPQKLSSLGLVHPKFFNLHGLDRKSSTTSHVDNPKTTMHEPYSLPSRLVEYTLECTAQQKPLVLLSLILEQKQQSQSNPTPTHDIHVVFTSSVESTHRLTRLLQLLWSTANYGPSTAVAEFSSALSQKQRSQVLGQCTSLRDGDDTTRQEQIEILVCSDGMSRGMDLPHVSTVINYDIPTVAKTYVHRCGRTARGTQKGTVINLLKKGQVASFLKMRRGIDEPHRVQSLNIQKYLQRNVVSVYKDCVKRLGQVIEAEKRGEIAPTESIQQQFVKIVFK